ncbi:MAG: deoxyribonuclease IV, partial [Nitrososphaerota archaeon]|nr:deoxyribonuclease IV [Nitrososphaerota archaeon]
LQMFTRSPRTWKSKPLTTEQVNAFKDAADKNKDISPIIVHAPYLANLSSPSKNTQDASKELITTELERCQKLGVPFMIMHLGSGLGSKEEDSIERMAVALNEIAKNATGATKILLENTAGSKNSTGSRLESIKILYGLLNEKKLFGCCLDTQHAFAAGYDLRDEDALKDLAEYSEKIRENFIGVIHLNDSKGGLGSGLDRHENIGRGHIGLSGFRAILSRKEIRHLPMILETPVGDYTDFKKDMQTVLKILSQTQ